MRRSPAAACRPVALGRGRSPRLGGGERCGEERECGGGRAHAGLDRETAPLVKVFSSISKENGVPAMIAFGSAYRHGELHPTRVRHPVEYLRGGLRQPPMVDPLAHRLMSFASGLRIQPALSARLSDLSYADTKPWWVG